MGRCQPDQDVSGPAITPGPESRLPRVTCPAQRRLSSLPEARGDYRYGPGKWSIKEVVGHLSDTERIFSYRALRVGRGDPTPLASFDDKAYAPEMGGADRTLGEMVAEWVAVRRATLTLFRGLPERAWQRRGVASGQPISVRALAYIIVGHARHHLEVLEARYAVEAHGAGDRARPSIP